jgi:hypothetical protein
MATRLVVKRHQRPGDVVTLGPGETLPLLEGKDRDVVAKEYPESVAGFSAEVIGTRLAEVKTAASIHPTTFLERLYHKLGDGTRYVISLTVLLVGAALLTLGLGLSTAAGRRRW